MKKIFSMFLTVMCFVCVAFAGLAFLPKADQTTGGQPEASAKFSGGEGTADDPYQIATTEDFQEMFSDYTAGKYYIQTANIAIDDVLTSDSAPNTFRGEYDGQGYELYVESSQDFSVAGLFKYVTGSAFSNMIIDYRGSTLSGEDSWGNYYATGGLTATASGSDFYNCAVLNVYIDASTGEMEVGGGIVGIDNSSRYQGCVFKGEVYAGIAGGIVGGSYNHTSSNMYLINCYASANIYASHVAGGIVGASGHRNIYGCIGHGYIDVDNIYLPSTGEDSCFFGGIVGIGHDVFDAAEFLTGQIPSYSSWEGVTIDGCLTLFFAEESDYSNTYCGSPIIGDGIYTIETQCYWYIENWDYPVLYDNSGGASIINCNTENNRYYSGELEGFYNDVLSNAYSPIYGYDGSSFNEYGSQSGAIFNYTVGEDCIPYMDYVWYISPFRTEYFGYAVAGGYDELPLLTWLEAHYVYIWDSGENLVESGHLANYTNNYQDMSEYEIGGDYIDGEKPTHMLLQPYVCEIGSSTYNFKSSTLSGFIATITYTESKNSTRKTVTETGYGWVGDDDILHDTSMTITVSVDGYVCMGIFLDGETVSNSSEVPTRTVNVGTGTDYDSYYQRYLKIYLKKISNNQLKSYFFEDGTFPQTAVVTYNTSLNTLLTNKQTSSTPSFTSNGTTYYTLTYSYSSSDGAEYQVYNGQKFLGFVYSNDTKTIKLKDKTGSLISCTFTKNTTYWFKYEPIRWRISNYNASASDLPDDFDEFAEGQVDFSVVTDVLWWDVLNSSSNNLGVGDNAMQTTFMQALANGDLFGSAGMSLKYTNDRVIEADEWNGSSTNQKHKSSSQTFSPNKANKTVSARYLRITGTGNNENGSNFVNKLSVVNSSGTETVLIDANASSTINYTTTGLSSWLDYSSAGKSCFPYYSTPFTIDMGSTKTIAGIYLRRYWTGSRIYYGTKIEYSTDNKTWYTYYDSGNNGAYGSHDATGAYVETNAGKWFYLPANAWVASLAEIQKYQSELGSYGSQLACVMAGVDQNKFLEYWTRDFGQQMGCGTYVTASGEVMKNSYYANKARGIRFAITMSEGSNMG